MIVKKYIILILIGCLSLSALMGCSENYVFERKFDFNIELDDREEDKSTVVKSKNVSEFSPQRNKEELSLEIYGIWSLDKIALKSSSYDGTSKEALGGIDEEDYLGLELEFTEKYVRLGADKFLNPKYTLDYITVAEYDDGGRFKLPSIYGFILNENIEIINSEKYEELSDVQLKFYQASFDEDYLIPVGTQVVILNNDTMLVGIWGKIILARRVEP